MEEIRLKTPLACTINFKFTNQYYYGTLSRNEKDKYVIKIFEKNGNPTGGRWLLSTLLEDGVSDFIYIDFGQKWGVNGMEKLLKEALTHI